MIAEFLAPLAVAPLVVATLSCEGPMSCNATCLCDGTKPPAVGNALLLTCTITKNGVPFDPTTVYAFAHAPNGTTTALATTKVSPGIYTAILTPLAPGPWIPRFSDAPAPPVGSTFVSEPSSPISVAPLLFS